MNYSRMCYRFSILEWSQFSVLLVISISSVHLLSHLVSSTCFSTAECNQTNGGVKVYIQAPPHAVPWCLTDNNCFVGLVFVLGKRRRSDCWCFLLFYCIWKWLLSDSYTAVFDQYVFVLRVCVLFFFKFVLTAGVEYCLLAAKVKTSGQSCLWTRYMRLNLNTRRHSICRTVVNRNHVVFNQISTEEFNFAYALWNLF